MIIHFNETELDLCVNDNSYRQRAIKGEHSLTLYFSLPEHIEIPVGAYCVFEGETYTLEAPGDFKKHNTRNFEYTLVMEASQAKLRKYKFRNPVDRRLKFSLTAQPKDHLKMLVDNLNKRDSGWKIGQCLTAAHKNIAFSHTDCMSALSQIADAFETEWEIVNKTIHLRKVEYNKNEPMPLSYGRGNGFKPGVGRTNFNDSKAIEILFVQGGEKNIDASKYGSKELLLPKSQTLRYDGQYFEGEVEFITEQAHTYLSDADGFSIRRQDKELQSKEEDSLDLPEIYPSRVGTVTKVEVTKEGFCDFFDTTIPEALDFSTQESRFKGETLTVIFQSGQLTGKEFEIQQDENRVFGYIHSERRFKVVEQTIDGEPMPKGAYMPIVGDTYSVFGAVLPDAYICDNATKTGASWDMFREAVKYLYEHEEQTFTFTGELDGIWAKKDWLNIGGRIKLGGYVLFSDEQFQREGVSIRIVGIKDYINNPHSPEIELSNSIVGSSIMSDLRKIESNEVIADSQYKGALQLTKRRFKDAQESTKMLEDAMLNFTGSVNPISVKTMQTLIGDDSLQYQFVSSVTNPKPVAHEAVYDDETKVLTVPAGILQHLTLGIDVVSSSHKYRFWNMGVYTSPVLTESTKSYYLYAKVSKGNSTAGTFYLSETPITMESEVNFYHLLYGTLGAEFEGARSFVSWYGYAELTPGRLTIPKIVSPDGKTYFDVARGEIGGTITFKSGSSGLKDLNEWSGVEQDISAAQDSANAAQSAADAAIRAAQEAQNYIDTTLPDEMQEINRRLDGVVESWFLPYTPTLNNDPTRAWITAGKQNQHIGDTFTNTQSFAFNPNDSREWEQGSSNGATNKPWEGDLFDNTKRLRTPNMLRVNGSVKISVTNGGIAVYYAATADGNLTGHQGWLNSVQINQTDHPYIALVLRINDTTPILPTDIATLGLVVEGDLSHVDAGKSWRWVDEGGYKWTPIADSDAVKALLEASKAQDLADQKRRVFVVQPTTPYEVGDMWAQGASGSGDLMRCIVSRPTGSFTTGDWDKASKYTDDAVVMDRIAKMANDKVITKEEKATLRNDLVQINTAYAAYQSDATKYGVSITALATAKTALSTLLTSTVKISTNEDTTLTDAQLVAYNKAFADYSAEVQRFANLVSKKQADDAVDNLEIGGVNLLSRSKDIMAYNSIGFGTTRVVSGKYMRFTINSSGQIYTWGHIISNQLNFSNIFAISSCYTFSAKLRASKEMTARIGFRTVGGGFVYDKKYTVGAGDCIISINFTYRGEDPMYPVILFWNINDTPLAPNDWIEVEYFMVEKGSKATDWTPSLADTQSEIDKAQTAADQAQAAADAANILLAEISSDTKLTPSEKQVVSREWEIIFNETAIIQAQAQKVGVSSYNYVTIYNELRSYIIPLLRDMTITSTIVSEVFRSRFNNYYIAKTQLLSSVTGSIQDNVSNMDYIKALFANGSTSIEGGVILTEAIALKGDDGSITGIINGSSKFKDSVHGIAMHILGIKDIKDWKNANTLMFQDGAIVTKSLELLSGCKVGDFEVRAGSGSMSGLFTSLNNGPYGNYESQWTSFGFVMKTTYGSKTASINMVPGSKSISDDQMAMMSISSTRNDLGGLHIEAHSESVAVYIASGYTTGLRSRSKEIFESTTLSHDDAIVIYRGLKNISVYLPANPIPGQYYEVVKDTTYSVTVMGNGKTINRLGYTSSASQIITNDKCIIKLRLMNIGATGSSKIWHMTIETATGA